jgi:hypothetical protein
MPLQKLVWPDAPKEAKPALLRLQRMSALVLEAPAAAKKPDRLKYMSMSEPPPEPVSEPEPVLAPMPEVVVTRVNRLASMANAEPAPLPEPAVRADKLARMRDVEMPVIEPVVEATPAKQKKWSFEFERNPNGTIRRINATEVED